jgi:hypothetical protein
LIGGLSPSRIEVSTVSPDFAGFAALQLVLGRSIGQSMEMLMRIVLIAFMMVLLAIPAHARGKQRSGEQPQQTADQQKKTRDEEKAYKDALKRIPNQKPVDPWSKVR